MASWLAASRLLGGDFVGGEMIWCEITSYCVIPFPVQRILAFDRLNLPLAYVHFFQFCKKVRKRRTNLQSILNHEIQAFIQIFFSITEGGL